jgi:hypothetical protein
LERESERERERRVTNHLKSMPLIAMEIDLRETLEKRRVLCGRIAVEEKIHSGNRNRSEKIEEEGGKGEDKSRVK